MAETSDNIQVLLKLFDTLKDSSVRNEASTNELIKQQMELVSHIQTLPVEDLRRALKEHSGTCTNNHEKTLIDIGQRDKDNNNKMDTIIKKVDDVSTKIKIMITVVAVSFTITMTALGFFKFNYNNALNTHEIQLQEFIEKFENKLNNITP